MISLVAMLGIFALSAAPPRADACSPFAPFYGMTSLRATASLEAGMPGACDLVATIPPRTKAGIPGAFLWYRRPVPAAPLRVSFRVRQASVEAGFFDIYELLSANPVVAVTNPVGINQVLLVGIGGDGTGTSARILIGGSCASTGDCRASFDIPAPVDATLRFEVDTNPAGGAIRAWLDADFADPPIAEITDVDNSASGGIASVSLGAFAPIEGYSDNGLVVRLSDVQSSDDVIFFSTLDGGARP